MFENKIINYGFYEVLHNYSAAKLAEAERKQRHLAALPRDITLLERLMARLGQAFSVLGKLKPYRQSRVITSVR
jgi:hypothetical protein